MATTLYRLCPVYICPLVATLANYNCTKIKLDILSIESHPVIPFSIKVFQQL